MVWQLVYANNSYRLSRYFSDADQIHALSIFVFVLGNQQFWWINTAILIKVIGVTWLIRSAWWPRLHTSPVSPETSLSWQHQPEKVQFILITLTSFYWYCGNFLDIVFVDVILYLSWFFAKLISHSTRKEVFLQIGLRLKSAINRELPTATLTRYNHTSETFPRANLMVRLIRKARKGREEGTLWLSQITH